MIHPSTELRFINEKKGYGLVATELIPKGTITWTIDKFDRIFTQQEVDRMNDIYQQLVDYYMYRNKKGEYILCWDNAKFVNHSFNSSCISTPYEFELAVRDIFPGEEITDDYGYLNVSAPFDCEPEEGTTRTKVYPDDLLKYYHLWDEKLIQAFKNFNNVEQPLLTFLEKDVLEIAQDIANGKRKMDSILECYFDPKKLKAA